MLSINNIVFKKIFVAFLLFVIAGAALFCMLIGVMSVSYKAHDMSSNRDAFMTHLVYAKELISATIVTTSLTLTIFFLMAVVAFALFYKLNLFLQLTLPGYLRQKRHDIFHVAQLIIYHWLSLFEQSPNFIKPA